MLLPSCEQCFFGTAVKYPMSIFAQKCQVIALDHILLCITSYCGCHSLFPMTTVPSGYAYTPRKASPIVILRAWLRAMSSPSGQGDSLLGWSVQTLGSNVPDFFSKSLSYRIISVLLIILRLKRSINKVESHSSDASKGRKEYDFIIHIFISHFIWHWALFEFYFSTCFQLCSFIVDTR